MEATLEKQFKPQAQGSATALTTEDEDPDDQNQLEFENDNDPEGEALLESETEKEDPEREQFLEFEGDEPDPGNPVPPKKKEKKPPRDTKHLRGSDDDPSKPYVVNYAASKTENAIMAALPGALIGAFIGAVEYGWLYNDPLMMIFGAVVMGLGGAIFCYGDEKAEEDSQQGLSVSITGMTIFMIGLLVIPGMILKATHMGLLL
jgi:hypothetical protein